MMYIRVIRSIGSTLHFESSRVMFSLVVTILACDVFQNKAKGFYTNEFCWKKLQCVSESCEALLSAGLCEKNEKWSHFPDKLAVKFFYRGLHDFRYIMRYKR